MKLKYLCFLVLMGLAGIGCDQNKDAEEVTTVEAPANGPTPLFRNLSLTTHKAAYKPGDAVRFTLDNTGLPAGATVRYKYLHTVLSETPVPGTTWTWTPPADDYRGYIAEVYHTQNGAETIYATVGVDVSSNWKKFPRYGFLSKFPQLSEPDMEAVIGNLNRHHINGIQFYDWHHKHHKPLAMNGSTPATSWKDIINREIYFSTVQKYIASAHSYNMKAMFYNLIYGVWDDGEADGVKREWYVYNDNTRTNRDFHPLPMPPFVSNIYLLDPANTEWQRYLMAENKKVYQALAFDGFHMDQLGDRGARFRFDGSALNLAQTYKPFIDAIRADEPQKDIVMNAVAQYGQTGIATSAADILYTEVWDPFNTFTDLANIIKQNNILSNNTKSTVLAAYMNYEKANNKGFFNTPSVLLANAVIFAFGGSHLELGEHMLGKEYFPNDNLSMSDDLKAAMINYYDFLVAYQNLLRDGGSFNTVNVASFDGKTPLNNWPPTQGAVSVMGKLVGDRQVIHVLNFRNANTLNWRDTNGNQPTPVLMKDTKLQLVSSKPVKKLWMASPDVAGGASRSLNFNQTGDKVSFILPDLKYWSMLVFEY